MMKIQSKVCCVLCLTILLAACTVAPTLTPTLPEIASLHPTTTLSPTTNLTKAMQTYQETLRANQTQNAAYYTAIAGEKSATAAHITPSLTPSITLQPSSTLRPTSTPIFNVANVVTFTPAPPAQCPPDDPSLSFDITPLYSTFQGEDTLLDLLNAGGAKSLITSLIDEEWENGRDYVVADLTDDGIPEIALGIYLNFYIFGCSAGQYHPLFTLQVYDGPKPSIEAIQDMNLDGIPELLIIYEGCPSTHCIGYDIIAWNGNTINYLIQSEWLKSPTWYGYDALVAWDIHSADVDNNGTIELVVNEIPPFPWDFNEAMFGPLRDGEAVYMWNGEIFARKRFTLSPAKYRFQAVQDADWASLSGDYDHALELYQEAIFSDQLDWWSPERAQYFRDMYYNFLILTPTPIPPAPDQSEYYRLAAYSRFRIILLHLLRGWETEAQVIYDNMVELFPSGNPGYPYVEMATLFWGQYQSSHNMGLACAQAIQYTTQRPNDILDSLGNIYIHTYQNHIYQPADVCPFTNADVQQ